MNNLSWLLLAIFFLTSGLTILAAWSFHKIRRIHVATYRLMDDVEVIRRETTVLFSQFQALLALERKLDLNDALPPVRGWAASPDFLLQIAHYMSREKPKTILECSSGISTLVAARCAQLNGLGHVFSLEHEPTYAAKTRDLLRHHGLQDWATVLDAPLEGSAGQSAWYSLKLLPANLPSVDLLVVDGPPASAGPLARYPALPRLEKFLAKKVAVFVDDADREDEQEMIRRWTSEFPAFSVSDLHCEKGGSRLVRKPDEREALFQANSRF
jgi:predicted O-methyltransferase YrrM